ncbi:hypothetical protein EG68_10791 [Paragonimus skrjabini miyazakii]|uniref:Regulator of microtubule dynamics protein 1 n=1 Tax=Paragonimus skrjabini miyazakii TaxID=59628 RepID=A0A8S9YF01_9TREM|nr:hypothetical protein EG68_10791 [Paragonimus skrjabini miyazakii]
MELELNQADKLMEEDKYSECVIFLGNLHNKDNPEVCWRQARVMFLQLHSISAKPDKHAMRAQLTAAMERVKVGLDADGNNANCLTWNGILVDRLSKLEGVNERIKNAFKIHDLWQKALQVDPKNYLANNCLGIWCYEVSDLPDIKRSLAKTFFTKPPTSTYEEALTYLNRCEELAPKKLVGNLLTLAKCHHRLKNKDQARVFCQAVMEFKATGNDAIEAQAEAKHLLKKLS